MVYLQQEYTNNITLTNNGSVTTNGSTTANVAMTLNFTGTATPTLTVSGDTLQGTAVTINGAVGSNLIVDNQGFIVATTGNIDITSTPNAGGGGNLTFGPNGGGTMDVTGGPGFINLTAANSGAMSNTIDFTASQTFNGTAILSATGAKQSVQVEAGADVVGAGGRW